MSRTNNLVDMSESEIKERYEDAFKSKVDQLDGGTTEKDWKNANAEALQVLLGLMKNLALALF